MYLITTTAPVTTTTTTLCLKKTSPTLSHVTWKPIIRFWWQVVSEIYVPKIIKWLFSFPPHPMFVSALPRENTTSKTSLFYPMRYDCL